MTTEEPDAGVATDAGADATPLTDAAPGTVAVGAPAMTFARAGTSVSIPVQIARGDGVSGPVEVVVAEPPSGVTFEPLVIAADATTGSLRATVAADAALRVETLALRAAAGPASGAAEAGIEIIGARGTANPGFGTDGTVTLDLAVVSGVVAGVVPQSERVVVVAYKGPWITAARVDLAGAPDSGFGDAGRLAVDLASVGGRNVSWAAASQDASGRIVVGGTVETEAGVRPFVLRTDRDGDIDAAMTPRLLAPRGEQLYTSLVAAQPDGGVVLSGSLTTTSGQYRLWSIRLRENGTVLSSDEPEAMCGQALWTVQADGFVVCRHDDSVQRLRPTGQLDTSFGTNGRTILPYPTGPAQWTAVRQVGAQFIAMGFDRVWRLGGTGALDTAFGVLGAATLPIVGFESGLNAFGLDNGHVLIQTTGVPLQGSDYYVGFYELDAVGGVVSGGGEESHREVVGWLVDGSAMLDRHRIVVAGHSHTEEQPVHLRQYWR